MQKRQYFKSLIKKDYKTKIPFCDGKNVEDEPYIALEFYSRQAKLTEIFLQFNAETGIQWLFGYANYINQNYVDGSTNPHLFRRKYSVGSLLMIDFFGGYGNELIFDHPAIVLQDLTNGLIVAPLTSTEEVYKAAPDNPLDIQLTRNAPPLGYLTKNSTIRLAQIRYISKKRVLSLMERKNSRDKVIEQRVSHPSKLNEIEVALCNLFGKNIFIDVLKQEESLARRSSALTQERQQLTLERESLALERESLTLERERLALEKESFLREQEAFKGNIQ